MSRSHKKLFLYVAIPLGCFFILFAGQAFFRSCRMQVVDASSLPLKIVTLPFRELKKIVAYRATYAKYTKLSEEVATLRAQIIGQEETLRENNRLRELLNFKKSLVFSSVAANVIGRDPSQWNATIIIDKGVDDGITAGMPVIAAAGVAGKITEVGRSTSKVILVTDPAFSVAAVVQRTREGGLLSGRLAGWCRMRYLPLEADIKTGDKILTSKLSSTFPEGLLIGTVMEVYESQSSPTLECLVQPAVSLAQLEEVLVIRK